MVAAIIDIRDGFAYMVQTRWLLAVLLFAILLVLVVMGPIEVLLPFAVKDQTGVVILLHKIENFHEMNGIHPMFPSNMRSTRLLLDYA